MVRKPLLALVALCALASLVVAQDAAPPNSSSHKVAGLEITAPQTVAADEGFVVVNAVCSGAVEWLVLSTSTRVKYKVSASEKELTIAVPTTPGDVVTIFCIGVVDGKPTPFARTDVTVKGGTDPPQPLQPPVGKLHITIVEDPSKRTPEVATILNSANLRKQLGDAGHILRVYSATDPMLKQKGLDRIYTQVGGPVVLIVQSEDGTVRVAQALPKTEAGVLDLVLRRNASGGR